MAATASAIAEEPRCAHCNAKIDRDWRQKRVGMHVVCVGCEAEYKSQRITQLEAQLKIIASTTHGKGADLARIALYSNTRNAPP